MATQRSLVLVCNSHIDPVWLWPWEEGLAATLATFRAAADLCEEFDGFVFCHNEALLYQWVEEYEPALFERIQRLVRAGRWHVMGGWYLQPDCNLPSGESFVRQILVGKRYFLEKLRRRAARRGQRRPVRPHARPACRSWRKAGYDGYLFCRPDRAPGSAALGRLRVGRATTARRSSPTARRSTTTPSAGRAARQGGALARGPRGDAERGLLLWGVGNHGGGPSREDLHALAALRADVRIARSCTARRRTTSTGLRDCSRRAPAHRGATSIPGRRLLHLDGHGEARARAARARALRHRERCSRTPRSRGCCPTRAPSCATALEDAAVLPVPRHPARATACARSSSRRSHRLGHGLDIVGRLRARAFFALLAGAAAGSRRRVPDLRPQPPPVPVARHASSASSSPRAEHRPRSVLAARADATPDGRAVPLQLEKESCNIQVDQRKRIVFRRHAAAVVA